MMNLVEVVVTPDTSEQTLETTLGVVGAMGKDAVVVKNSPGFVSTRLGAVQILEAMRLVEEGIASPEDIDTIMKSAYNHPMGPLRLADLIGLDVKLAIMEELHGKLGEHYRPPDSLREKVAAGKLGKKTGEGFYKWD